MCITHSTSSHQYITNISVFGQRADVPRYDRKKIKSPNGNNGPALCVECKATTILSPPLQRYLWSRRSLRVIKHRPRELGFDPQPSNDSLPGTEHTSQLCEGVKIGLHDWQNSHFVQSRHVCLKTISSSLHTDRNLLGLWRLMANSWYFLSVFEPLSLLFVEVLLPLLITSGHQ